MLLCADLLGLVCRNVLSARSLGMIARTDKAANRLLMTTPEPWVLAGEAICGDSWPELKQVRRAQTALARYHVMLRVCPWVSVPQEVTVQAFYDVRRRGGTYRVHKLRMVKRKCELSCTRTLGGREEQIRVVVPPRRLSSSYCLVRQNWTEEEMEDEGADEYLKELDGWRPPTPYGLREVQSVLYVHDGVLCAVCSAPLVRVANGPVSLFFLCRKTRRVLQMLDFPRGARSLPKCVVFECGEMWVLSETKRAVLYYGPRADRALCVG
jgi:hypothetical protein